MCMSAVPITKEYYIQTTLFDSVFKRTNTATSHTNTIHLNIAVNFKMIAVICILKLNVGQIQIWPK